MKTGVPIQHFTDLNAWKEAHRLTLSIYKETKSFPPEERFGLISQIRRAVISAESNIAEGFGRNTQNDKRQFYTMARGSLLETETQLIVAKDLGYLKKEEFSILHKQVDTTGRLLTGLLKSAISRDRY